MKKPETCTDGPAPKKARLPGAELPPVSVEALTAAEREAAKKAIDYHSKPALMSFQELINIDEL